VRQSKVVINTVGPYWISGKPVVACCARNGVHYLDLTGEAHFVWELVEKFDYLANKNNTMIVPACGFDSVPSDLTVYLSNKTLKSVLGPDASIQDSLTAWSSKAGLSKGTLASAMAMFDSVPKQVLRAVSQPYPFNPYVRGLPNPPERLVYSVPHSRPKWYGAQWMMRYMNRPIVQRSWSLFAMAKRDSPANAHLAYGDQFRYDECMRTPGFWSALCFSVVLGIVAVGMLAAPFRWLVKRIIPRSWEATVVAGGFLRVVNVSSSNQTSVRSSFKLKGMDPAYDGSGRMVSEAALSIIFNFDELPYHLVGGGGILTPMTAFGDVLINRLTKYAEVTVESEVVRQGDRRE